MKEVFVRSLMEATGCSKQAAEKEYEFLQTIEANTAE